VLLSTYSCKCNFRLETGCVITAWASCHYNSHVDGKVRQLQDKNPIILTVQISRATSKSFNSHVTINLEFKIKCVVIGIAIKNSL